MILNIQLTKPEYDMVMQAIYKYDTGEETEGEIRRIRLIDKLVKQVAHQVTENPVGF